MTRYLLISFLFPITFAATGQDLPVMTKSQLFATIVQGKIDKNVKWDSPKLPGKQGYLGFEFLYPRTIVRDSQEISYHLDMEHRLFVSFFNAKELQGLRNYEVAFPISPGHGADTYEMRLDPNFRDMEESPYLRLERLTRAIPYFAWSNYLTISHSDRGTVIVNLKDVDEWTPESGREDFCNALAFAVYYYAFKQQLPKPLLIIYRAPGNVLERYEYPVGTDFRKYLNLFDNH
jgi:hypothetical protein